MRGARKRAHGVTLTYKNTGSGDAVAELKELAPDGYDDVFVFEESDERFFVSIGETRSDRWIVVQSDSKTSTETQPS